MSRETGWVITVSPGTGPSTRRKVTGRRTPKEPIVA